MGKFRPVVVIDIWRSVEIEFADFAWSDRWMGARANFKDEEALKGYEKGYTAFVEFFKEHLV
jgi:hypothetical protein